MTVKQTPKPKKFIPRDEIEVVMNEVEKINETMNSFCELMNHLNRTTHPPSQFDLARSTSHVFGDIARINREVKRKLYMIKAHLPKKEVSYGKD